MPSLSDTTLQLTADDLITIVPGIAPTSSEPTVQLTAADVMVLEGIGSCAPPPEVILRPSDLRPLMRAHLAAKLEPVLAAAQGRAISSWSFLRRSARLAWSGACRAGAAVGTAAILLARVLSVVSRSAVRHLAALTVAIWTGLLRVSRRAWDASFPVRDWLELKIRRYPREVGDTTGALMMRPARPTDRGLVEDLQRALSAYCAGQGNGNLLLAEVEGRVAVLVPGREPKVEVSQGEDRSDSTAHGRPTDGRPTDPSTR